MLWDFPKFLRKQPIDDKTLTGGVDSFFLGSSSAGRPGTERSAIQMTAAYAYVQVV